MSAPEFFVEQNTCIEAGLKFPAACILSDEEKATMSRLWMFVRTSEFMKTVGVDWNETTARNAALLVFAFMDVQRKQITGESFFPNANWKVKGKSIQWGVNTPEVVRMPYPVQYMYEEMQKASLLLGPQDTLLVMKCLEFLKGKSAESIHKLLVSKLPKVDPTYAVSVFDKRVDQTVFRSEGNYTRTEAFVNLMLFLSEKYEWNARELVEQFCPNGDWSIVENFQPGGPDGQFEIRMYKE